MEEIKTQAIVLKAQDYKDSGKLLTIFSLEHGLMQAKINGVTKPKAKLAFAAQPFCFGEYIITSKFTNTIINCTCIETFFELTQDFDKFVAGMGMLEICIYLVKAEDPCVELFLLLLKCLRLLNFSKAMPLAVLIKFTIEALSIGGFKLKLDACKKCLDKNPTKVYFSFDNGGILCPFCAGQDDLAITMGEWATLKIIDKTNLDNFENLKFTSIDTLCETMKLLIKYFYDKTGENLSGVSAYL